MYYELVKVLNRQTLLNPVQIECRYRAPDGKPLARGIYAVLWRTGAVPSQYERGVLFYGPFPSWRAASDFVRTCCGTGRTEEHQAA